MPESMSANFANTWTDEEKTALAQMMTLYVPGNPVAPFAHQIRRAFSVLFGNNEHSDKAFMDRCRSMTKSLREGAPARNDPVPTVATFVELVRPQVSSAPSSEPALPEPEPAPAPEPDTEPAQPESEPADTLDDPVAIILRDACSVTSYRRGLTLNHIYEVIVVEPRSSGVILGLIHNGEVVTGFCANAHIWKFGATYYPPHYFQEGDVTKAMYTGQNPRGNTFSIIKAGVISPPQNEKPTQTTTAVAAPVLSDLDKLVIEWENRILNAPDTNTSPRRTASDADRNSISHLFKWLTELDLPAYDWLLDAIAKLSGSHRSKRTSAYLQGMIRNWVNLGKFQFDTPELADVLEVFEGELKVAPTRDACTVLVRLMAEHGPIRVAASIVKFAPSMPAPDLSVLYASAIEDAMKGSIKDADSTRHR